MLNFHFSRDRKTQAYTCVSLHAETDAYKARYEFDADGSSTALAPDVLGAVLSTLDGLPYQPGLFHFPDFSYEAPDVALSGAQVFQNLSSLNDAMVTFKTKLSKGASYQLLREFRADALEGRPQALDLLLRTTMHVLNINVLQIQKLENCLEAPELQAMKEQHSDLVSLLKNAADLAGMGSGADPAGLNPRLAALALEDFNTNQQ